MTVRYVGRSENSNNRLAIIGYEPKEEEMANKVLDKMVEYGWKLSYGEEEELCFEVYDREEYREFVSDYKKAKKEAKE
jgi:hypothetical protein